MTTVEEARTKVREMIARFPGAIPVGALAEAEAAIRTEAAAALAEERTRVRVLVEAAGLAASLIERDFPLMAARLRAALREEQAT